ncbi:MAG: hypothetical protein FWD87_06325 [Spirochaetaceae bacterium]|nr:hypothetical protein [Spirochaetaceae bacterium]
MNFDKEEEQFLDELNSGKFKIERIPNAADDYQNYEDRDLAAYKSYLQSDAFKSLEFHIRWNLLLFLYLSHHPSIKTFFHF